MPVEIVRGEPAVAAGIQLSRKLMSELDAPVTARETWLTAALHCLPSGRPAAVLSRSATGALSGAAFLTVTRARGFAAVGLVGEGVSDHARLLAADPAAAADLARGIRSVLDGIRGPWRLSIEQVPHGDPVLAELAASLPHGLLSDGDVCPVTRFRADRNLTGYLSKNGRATAKQGRNRLTRVDPDWRVERTRDPAEIAARLPTTVSLHRQRDHAQGRRSDFDDPRRVDFYTTVTRALAEQGVVELATLWVNGATAAYFVILVDGSVWRLWDGRISGAHSHLRVGRVLDVTLLSAALDDPGVTALDWMRGDLEHKRQAANGVVRTQKLVAWSGASLRAAERYARWGRRHAQAVLPALSGRLSPAAGSTGQVT